MDKWIIVDWAYNHIRPNKKFNDFEDAWGYIREEMHPDDEEVWQEYEVLKESEYKELKSRKNPTIKQENLVWYAVLAGFIFLAYKLRQSHKSYSLDVANKNNPQAIVAGVRG